MYSFCFSKYVSKIEGILAEHLISSCREHKFPNGTACLVDLKSCSDLPFRVFASETCITWGDK